LFKNSLYRRFFVFFTIFYLVSIFSCQKNEVNSYIELKPNVIVIINGEVVNVKTFKKELRLTRRKYRVENNSDQGKKEILFLKLKTLNTIIQNILFKQEAKKYKLGLDPEEYKDNIKIFKPVHLDESFKKTFKIQKISQLEWEEKLKSSLILKKLIDNQVNRKVTVGEDVAKKYFEENSEEFQKGKQVQALHIMVGTEEEARRLLKKIKSNKAKFSEMAVKHSLGPESVEGGNLGYFTVGQMPAEFESVFDLRLYETSEVIQTPYGFHILKVVDKKPARKMNYQESKRFIIKKLLRKKQEEAFTKWLMDLKNKAIININYEAIKNVQ